MVYVPKRTFWGAPPPPDFDPQKDYYKILGVKNDSTQAEIKSRYIKIAQEMHPDKNPNADQDKFKEITAAYNLLSNQEKRKQYDEMRKYGSPFNDASSGNTYGGAAKNPYSDGFNPFGQGFGNTGNQQGKKYQRTYYYTYKGDPQKAKKDFEDFFKSRGAAYGSGANFRGFEEFIKAMRENMEKRQQQNQEYYNHYNQNNQYNQNNYQQNNSQKSAEEKKREEEEEYFRKYYQEFNNPPRNFGFRLFINFIVILFTIWFFTRLLTRSAHRESIDELYQRQILQDSYDKGTRYAGMGGSPPPTGGIPYGMQQNQYHSLQNLQSSTRFYDPHAAQYVQDERNRQVPNIYGR